MAISCSWFGCIVSSSFGGVADNSRFWNVACSYVGGVAGRCSGFGFVCNSSWHFQGWGFCLST